MPADLQSKTILLQAWRAGVGAVGGERATRDAIAADGIKDATHLLAVGKAAGAMCAGAMGALAPGGRTLAVSKYGHFDAAFAARPRVTVMEAGHPLPDENSLRAGQAAAEFVGAAGADARLVMLVSGGASALAEALPRGAELDALRRLNRALLGGGFDIAQINAARMRASGIKGGKLLRRFRGASAHVYAISDVRGDDIGIIGGGLGALGGALPPLPEVSGLPGKVGELLAKFAAENKNDGENAAAPAFNYRARVIATNRDARDAAEKFLRENGLCIAANEESLHRDIHAAAQRLGAALRDGPAGAYIWGGEPGVTLPPKPGRGGRNQSLALLLAGEIRGRRGISALVAGTDGDDGSGGAAGALVDGATFTATRGAARALEKADAGTYLARIAALFKPGPTGTNVMDLALAIKS